MAFGRQLQQFAGIDRAKSRRQAVRLESGARDAFERFGIYHTLPRDHVFHSVDEAVRKLGT